MTIPAQSLVSHPYYEGVKSALLAAATQPSALQLTQGRIYPDQLPADANYPAVRYAMASDTPDQRLSNANNTDADIRVDIYADRHDRGRAFAIDAEVRRVLDRQNLTVTGFSRVDAMCIQRGRPLQEPGVFRVTSLYRLHGSAS